MQVNDYVLGASLGTGSTHDFWRVADVRIEAGRRCSIEPVDRVERVQHDGSPFPR